MLTTDDIARLFSTMRITYGPQWKHGAEAIEPWRRALHRFSPAQIEQAAVDMLETHIKHPPSLPEFKQIVDPPGKRPRADTRSLPGPVRNHANRVLNFVLLRLVIDYKGLDRETLQRVVGMKSALAEEYGDARMTDAQRNEHRKELMALANHRDRDQRNAEAQAARDKRHYAGRTNVDYKKTRI